MKVYLDYYASTPMARKVRDAMRPFLTDQYGNPSSGNREYSAHRGPGRGSFQRWMGNDERGE